MPTQYTLPPIRMRLRDRAEEHPREGRARQHGPGRVDEAILHVVAAIVADAEQDSVPVRAYPHDPRLEGVVGAMRGEVREPADRVPPLAGSAQMA